MHKPVAIIVLALSVLAHFPYRAPAPAGAASPTAATDATDLTGPTHKRGGAAEATARPAGFIDFTYDDPDFVENNASIRSFDTAWRAAFSAFPPEQPERGLYRPLTNLSYAVDYAFFGDNARGYHFVNTALYLAVVLLVYALALRWFHDPRVAFAAALVFAVHPVHCDAVDSISGRSELLALGFGVASWLAFDRATQPGAQNRRLGTLSIVSALFYAAASLSKETGVLLPAVFVLHLLGRDGAPLGAVAFLRRALDSTSLYLGVAFLYLALRLEVLGGFGPGAPVLAGIDAGTRALTIGAVFAEYIRLLSFPDVLQLDFYYQQAVGVPEQLSARILFGWAAIAALVGAFAFAVVSTLRGDDRFSPAVRRAAVVGLGTFLVFLAPVSHLIDIGALMAERFLFAPSLGFVFAAIGLTSLLLERWIPATTPRRAVATLLLVAIGLAGFVRSAARAAEWRDGVKLWESAARHAPDDYRSYSNIATHWIERGNFAEAERALRRALELEPGDRASSLNLSVVLLESGALDDAEAIHRSLLRANPADFVAWYNLANLERRRFEHSRALDAFEKALAANPNFAPARDAIAATQKQVGAARRFLLEAKARARDSSDPELLTEYARACRMTRDYACAVKYEERAATARN